MRMEIDFDNVPRDRGTVASLVVQVIIRALLLVAYILVVVASYGSNAGKWFCGQSNKDITQIYHVMLSPSGWAFSIWGVIYALEALYVLWAAIPLGIWNRNRTVLFTGPPMVVVFLLESTWLWLFNCEHMSWQSVVLVLALGAMSCAYVAAYLNLPDRLDLFRMFGKVEEEAQEFVGLVEAEPEQEPQPEVPLFANLRVLEPATGRRPWKLGALFELIVVWLPISLNLGWLICATVLGILFSIEAADVSISRDVSAVVIAVLGVAAVAVGTLARDPVVPITMFWGVVGILSNNATDTELVLVGLVALMFCGACVILVTTWRVVTVVRANQDHHGMPQFEEHDLLDFD